LVVVHQRDEGLFQQAGLDVPLDGDGLALD